MKLILSLGLLILAVGCSNLTPTERLKSSVSYETHSSNLEKLDWHIAATQMRGLNYVYTPFNVDGNNVTLYTGGPGSNPNNGLFKLMTTIGNNKPFGEKKILSTGPDLKAYNYFRAPRTAKNGHEVWMLVEIAGCYSGCDNATYPKTLGVYKSLDDGESWTFIDYLKVDGKPYVGTWMAHTGLIYNPAGDEQINMEDLTQNKFITTGEDKNIFVSNDGVNYRSVPMNHPFPRDRLVFTSMAKTPYGYHMMSCANWSDNYYTTTVRHLFSKDLVNWIPLESTSSLKHPNFYKGIHLSYDKKADKLWAISPCGSNGACSIMAWLTPKDYMLLETQTPESGLIPVGEYVYYKGRTALILDKTSSGDETTYKIRFSDGAIDSGYTKEMFNFPLTGYDRQGCQNEDTSTICVGDAVYVSGQIASISGIAYNDSRGIRYAVRFSNGTIDTGYTRDMLKLP